MVLQTADENGDRLYVILCTRTLTSIVLTEDDARQAWGQLGAALEQATDDGA